MRLLKRKVVAKNGSGFVLMQADESEDMYTLYNLINQGDQITADTVRNVSKESATGSTTKKRVNMRLKIEVEKVEFDAEQCTLRINGRNTQEHEHVKLGQYHTIELEVGHPVGLEKPCWDAVHFRILDESCDLTKRAELAVVVMQEGLAYLCLITPSMTLTKLKIERSMPKKRQGGGGEEFEKAKRKFFHDILEGIRKHIDFSIVKAVLIGSPGYLKDDFMAYYDTECVLLGTEGVEMMRQKPRYIKAHTSSGHRRAVDELLGNPELSGQLGHVKAAEEVKILQKFHDTLAADPDRACYGPPDVMYADTQLAIENLLVTDSLFRSSDILIRRKYVALTESVIEHGGRVHVFSTLHVSGEQLTMYSGVAAILRYPLVIPEDLPLVSDSVASDTLASSLRKMNV